MEQVQDRNVGDVLGLLESSQEEVVQEVRSILKDTLANVRDGWLVTGLLDYFFVSNSDRLLDILLTVTEPHDRHLLERITEGLKGPDRFRYTCLLLYAVRRQPPPMWIRKVIHHSALRELLHTLGTDEDVPVLVSGVMVLVMLLPILPLEMGKLHLSNVMDVFCRLVRWSPKQEPDKSFQPYLQVAVYTLFHRLYALYPCHFITCLQNNFTKPGSSACFFTTLKPMMESVRLHPILITENRETEVAKSRWMGIETHQLIQECAKLCLDPVEATPEEVCGPNYLLSGGNDFESLPEPSNWMISASGNNFWSPSLAQPSPPMATSSRGSTSVPHTPVFPILTPNQKAATKVAESPPEAAIEATPETTPFTSPLKLDGNKLVSRRPIKPMGSLNLNSADGGGEVHPTASVDFEINCSPLSPQKKDHMPFRFPDKQGQDIFKRAERNSLLQSKLQQIQRERQLTQKEISFNQSLDDEAADGKDPSKENNLVSPNKEKFIDSRGNNSGEFSPDIKTEDEKGLYVDVKNRKRKISVYDGSRLDISQLPNAKNSMFNGNSDSDITGEAAHTSESDDVEKDFVGTNIIDRRISEEKESDSGESRRSSDDNRLDLHRDPDEPESLGLGVPSQRSMTDLVKNVRTMRLRFLSQCGPPPDLSQYKLSTSSRGTLSPLKSYSTPMRPIQRSMSCPQLVIEDDISPVNGNEIRTRKGSAMSSFTLSPTRQAVITSEATTQTEEVANIIIPYDQILDALISAPSQGGKVKISKVDADSNDTYNLSPHQLLDQYLRESNEANIGVKSVFWQHSPSGTGNGFINQIKLMQTMLLLERYKREVHAERNRRLLGRAKKVYALEEQQKGLNKEVLRLENEVVRLKHDLLTLQTTATSKEQQLQSALNLQQGTLNQVCVDRDSAQQERDLLREKSKSLSKENEELVEQLHEVQATLLERDRQLTMHAQLAEDNTLLHHQVEMLHKQISLMGEVIDQYKHQVWQLTMSGQGDGIGIGLERATAQKQVEELKTSNRITNIKLDAALARVSELEQNLADKERLVSEHQKDLRAAREAGLEQSKAAERRCQALAATNQTLESYILEHNDKIDRLVRQVRRSQRGKSVCSDGFDIDLDLSASPSSASCSSAATSPPDEPLLSRHPVALNRLDALAELEIESEIGRRKT
ncbi:hamartin [Halocaridina rubra]|uniref:Hamartin n=1 Tax=Halocaridina rubra TaxID=373956 RepID=A0AAN8WIH7_HALRR